MTARALLVAALLGAARAGSAAELPRLSGTVVAPDGRMALFDTGGGATVPLREGETIGGFVIRSIGAGGVRLERDGDAVVLHPGAARAPAVPATTAGAPFGVVLRAQPPPDD